MSFSQIFLRNLFLKLCFSTVFLPNNIHDLWLHLTIWFSQILLDHARHCISLSELSSLRLDIPSFQRDFSPVELISIFLFQSIFSHAQSLTTALWTRIFTLLLTFDYQCLSQTRSRRMCFQSIRNGFVTENGGPICFISRSVASE